MELMGSVLLLCVGFVMLIKGSDFFVEGASRIAEKFGIPQLVIGLTIVAMGTSAPEAAVSRFKPVDYSTAAAGRQETEATKIPAAAQGIWTFFWPG